MSVADDIPVGEKEAKEQLEFYGFWLWNYRHARLPSGYSHHILANSVYIPQDSGGQFYLCDECQSYNHYKICDLCTVRAEYNKIMFIAKIYHAWDGVPELDGILHQLRLTGEEILQDAYRHKLIEGHALNYSCGYRLTPRNVATEILNETTREAYYNADSHVLNLEIDFSYPLEILIDDITRIKTRISRCLRNGQFQPTETAWDDMPHGISYARLLNILKKFPDVSFQVQPEKRSLGFWLWEQVDLLNNFKTVTAAIRYLRSGDSFPSDILESIGLNYPETRQYNRLCQSTRKCVERGEVLAIK